MTTPATSTRTTMCSKNEGGCGRRFEVASDIGDGPAPKLCSRCAARDPGPKKPRGRLYDCDGCGDEFRYEHNDDEGSGLTKICGECRKHGPRCLGGCGVRSKAFGAAGKTHCADCKAKRTAAAHAPASSRSLLGTGYAEALRDRMQAADEKIASVAPSPMFVRSAPPPAHHIELRSRIADEPVIEVIGQNRDALGTPVTLSPDDPFWREHAPPHSKPDDKIEAVEQPEEKRPMAREATCQKSAGGCGIVFKAQSSTGKLPVRCPECKAARGARPSGSSAPRKEKAPRKKREREHENSVTFAPKASTTAATTSSTLFTVRINALAIDCHSVEALDVLVQRYGGTLAP